MVSSASARSFARMSTRATGAQSARISADLAASPCRGSASAAHARAISPRLAAIASDAPYASSLSPHADADADAVPGAVACCARCSSSTHLASSANRRCAPWERRTDGPPPPELPDGPLLLEKEEDDARVALLVWMPRRSDGAADECECAQHGSDAGACALQQAAAEAAA